MFKAIRTPLAALALGLLATAAQAYPEIGKPAPDFDVKDISGKQQKLSAYKGQIVVLEWHNPECPFVKKHYDTQNMQKLQKELATKDVAWLTINSGAAGKQGSVTAEEAKAYLKNESATPTAYILDPAGTIGHSYESKSTPTIFVISKDGTLAYAGAIDDKSGFDKEEVKTAKNYVRAAVGSLQAGKPVEVAETKGYGCSVKYDDAKPAAGKTEKQ